MSADQASFQVKYDALLDARKLFAGAADDMKTAGQSYQRADATGTPGCFGLVTGASDELYKEYESFYDSMRSAVDTLHQTLDYASEAFLANHATYQDAEWANLLDNH